ncbi:MAG: xanthine dehydrogenase family protein subunit M [Pyrinomonadaceae bacterium]
MFAAPFDYEQPSTLAEAVALLARDPEATKILAGGHSLIPAMKLRLAQPQLLVDIARIKDLSYIREEGDQILIGATTTHYQLESSDLLKQTCPLIPACGASIGDVQVRNKGTIGGSLAHSDPAGDWPAAVLALRAELVATGPGGDRTIKAEDFFLDLLTTALEPDEILREIRIRKPIGAFAHVYRKVPHPASGFAVVGIAIALELAQDGKCETAGIGITGVGPKAYIAQNSEATLKGSRLDDSVIANAAEHVCDGVDPNSDLYASGEYRCLLAKVHLRRALSAASGKR